MNMGLKGLFAAVVKGRPDLRSAPDSRIFALTRTESFFTLVTTQEDPRATIAA
jgi:hypothetical protein